MRQMIFLLLILSACSGAREQQQLAVLQKKLGTAEKKEKKLQDEVKKISSELNAVQLSFIRKQLDDYEKQKDKTVRLFLEEREALYRIIQTASQQTAAEAQVELDRILRFITEQSEHV